MKTTPFRLALITLLSLGFAVSGMTEAWARGGGGRGGGGGRVGGGGGGARMGGGGMGGGVSRPSMPSRPAPSSRPSFDGRSNMGGNMASRSPSMSRPNVGGQGGFGEGRNGLGQGAGNRLGEGGRPGEGNRLGDAGAGRFGEGGSGFNARPSQRDVADFLNLPQQPSTRAGAASTLPARGTSAGSKTITGPGGGSVTVAGKGGTRTGPGGTTVGAGRVGVKVTGPGGNSYVKVGGGAAVRGPWGNTVAAGRGASFVNGQFVGGKTWSAVNGNFRHWNYYGAGWAARYPGCWWPGKWAVAGSIWTAATWATAGAYCGCSDEPYYYDYDDNMTYQDGNVYYGDESLGTTQEYYDQTAQVAAQGAEPMNEDWMPLGVYAIVQDGVTDAEKLIQLAVNKEGAIRGNYHDLMTDQVTPISGAVDKMTQRVAFKLEGPSSVLVETGLYNLTNDECPVLVHVGSERQVSRVMVRLKQPDDQAQQE